MPKNGTVKKRPAKTKTEPKKQFSLRIEQEALDAAEGIVAEQGLGDRANVMRLAARFGLRAFMDNPKNIQKADKITFE